MILCTALHGAALHCTALHSRLHSSDRWGATKFESHFYHDKGWQLAGWEYLAPPNGSPPYCSKSMNAYSAWKSHLVISEKELLQHCMDNALVTCPEALTPDLLAHLPQVKNWFSSKAALVTDGGAADRGAADEAADIAVPMAGAADEAAGGAAPMAGDAAATEAEQTLTAVPTPDGAAESKKKKKEKAVLVKELPTILRDIEHLVLHAPEPGCRRPYGNGPGFCNSTVQQTCCRPPTCQCPKNVNLVRQVMIDKKQVEVTLTEKQVGGCRPARPVQSSALQSSPVQCRQPLH